MGIAVRGPAVINQEATSTEKSEALLRAYLAHRDSTALRDALVTAHLPLITRIARNTSARLNVTCMDKDDATQHAAMGFMKALANYDQERLPGYEGFLQHAGFYSWREIIDAVRKLEGKWANGEHPIVVSFGDYIPTAGSHTSRRTDSESPVEHIVVDLVALEGIMSAASRVLKERELLVLNRVLQGEPIKKLGLELDVSESMISRIHTEALRKLRAALGCNNDQPAPQGRKTSKLPEEVQTTFEALKQRYGDHIKVHRSDTVSRRYEVRRYNRETRKQDHIGTIFLNGHFVENHKLSEAPSAHIIDLSSIQRPITLL